jgi:hypothetical protein
MSRSVATNEAVALSPGFNILMESPLERSDCDAELVPGLL